MVRTCAFDGCRSSTGLHSFPSDPNMARRWLQMAGRSLQSNTTTMYICNRHFSQECFSNYREVELGFVSSRHLRLTPSAVPNPADFLCFPPPANDASTSQTLPVLKHVASQTDPAKRRLDGTQQKNVRSIGTQTSVPSRDRGVCTLSFPLDSPLLFLHPTIVKRPSKRPRLSLKEEEEGPSECTLSMVVHEPEDSS